MPRSESLSLNCNNSTVWSAIASASSRALQLNVWFRPTPSSHTFVDLRDEERLAVRALHTAERLCDAELESRRVVRIGSGGELIEYDCLHELVCNQVRRIVLRCQRFEVAL